MPIAFVSAFLKMFVQMFAALFPVINPPGMALIFLGMTRSASRDQRTNLAKRVSIYSFLIISISYHIGAFILGFFGISVPVLRVAGGMVLAASGWRLLNETRGKNDTDLGVGVGSGSLAQLAFYPLTMPITTGPGTISVAIALGASHTEKVPFMLGALAASAAVSASIFLCYRYADRIEGALGQTGSDALSRLFAFILICIGIQLLWGGFSELWTGLSITAPVSVEGGS
jgi:multiple antibiotic resistance protein